MEMGSVSELAYIGSHGSLAGSFTGSRNMEPRKILRQRSLSQHQSGPAGQPPPPSAAASESARKWNDHRDHGYAWVIMLGSLLGFVCHGAISTTSTLTYRQLLIRFQMTATGAGWITALHGSVRMFSSPFVSLLCYRLSYRAVTFLGGLLYSGGLVLMAYSPSPFYVYIAYGVIAAIGSNMFILSSFVVLSQYFDTKRGKAMGVAFCGAGLGTIIFSPLIAWLYETQGFTYTLMIMAGLVLQMCISAALFRPPPPAPLQQQTDMKLPSDSSVDESDEQADTSPPPLPPAPAVSGCCLLVVTQLGLASLKRPVFLYVCILISSLMGQIFCAYIYTSGLAVETCGLTEREIAIVLSVGGFCELPARLMAGVMLDFKIFRPNRLYVFAIFSLCSGMLFLSLQFARGLVSMAVLWGMYQAFTLAVHTQHVMIIAEVLPPDELLAGIGISRLFQGVGLTIGPTMVGLMKDNLDTYTYGYWLIGGVQTLLGAIFIPVSCYFYRNSLKTKDVQQM